VTVDESLLRENLEKTMKTDGVVKSGQATPEIKIAPAQIRREDLLAELLLALLVKFPDHINYCLSNLEAEYIDSPALSRFYNNLIIYYNKFTSLEYEAFRVYLAEAGAEEEKILDKLILLGEKDFYDYEPGQVKAEIIKIVVDLKKFGWQKKIKHLEKMIAVAEQSGENTELELLMTELKSLTDQLRAINLV